MKSLTAERMRDLHGSLYQRGDACGVMVGALGGALYFSWAIPASFIFMFTPVVCLFDYAGR